MFVGAWNQRLRKDGRRALHGIVARNVGLHDHLAAPIHPPRPARNLNNLLRHALTGTKIGTEQALVGIDNADQGDGWKVHC